MRIEARNITSQWVYIVLILTVIASGCNSTAGETVMPTRQPEAGNSTGSPEPTAIPSTPTHEVTPTDTPTAAVQALSGTNTPSSPIEAKFRIDCIELLPALPAVHQIRGVVILSPIDQLGESIFAPKEAVVFLNLATATETSLPQDGNLRYDRFRVSPDRAQVVYRSWLIAEEQSWLVVAGGAAQTQASLPFQADHWSYYDWVDERRLVIRWRAERLSTSAGLDIVWVDPFTGKEELITTAERFPPNVNVLAGTLLWDFPLVYDSKLELVAYPGVLDTGEDALTLWSIDQQKNLTSRAAELGRIIQEPTWSPGETQFAFAMPVTSNPGSVTQKDELFSINREGQLTRLTYLTNFYPQVDIATYSWSPDGNYIAFWIRNPASQERKQELAILDIEKQRVTNYCVPGDDYQLIAPAPIWSPDGQQLAVENRSADGKTRQVLIIDLENSYAAQIAKDRTIEGWMLYSDE